MTKVLLLEDDPTYDSHFEKTFGPGNVDSFRTVDEVATALNSSTSWNYAFLDFDLGKKDRRARAGGVAVPPEKSGLSAFALLREQSPRTKLIGFTNVDENSRTLFAVAAYRWFQMSGLLDKREATSNRLKAIVNGKGLMPNDFWAEDFQRHAWRVDHLFANRRWARLWQEVLVAGAQPHNLAKRVAGESEAFARKTFVPGAADAAVGFSAAFLEQFELNSEKPQLILIEFVRQNYTFFKSPDLLDILEIARPWDRVRARR